MKKLLIILIAAVSLTACGTAGNKEVGTTNTGNTPKTDSTGNTTTIQWLDSTHMDLGQVKKGRDVEVAFHFKNTGENNLIIEDVKPGCGCTDPVKPEEPIAPGKEGVIKAKFKSEGQAIGPHTKNITVTANTNPSKTIPLTFKVDVIE